MDLEQTPQKDNSIVISIPRGMLSWLVALPLFFALGLGLGYALWGMTPAAAPAQAAALVAEASPTPDVPITRYDVSVDDDPSIGPADAPITIIEFSDYQCPYCQKWHAEVFARLLEDYDGQVRFVYRDFPLTSIHPGAFPAAEAANCAKEQGKYWEFHNGLFSGLYAMDAGGFAELAAALDLNTESFAQCMEERRYADEVQADYDFAANLGIRSTPTFFINGIAVVGAQPYDVFAEVIDKELAGELD